MEKPPATLPSLDSKQHVRLKVRLTRLKLESQEKIQARQAELQLQHQLEVKIMEIEAEKAIQLRHKGRKRLLVQ